VTNGTTQYILGAAHVLALGPTGLLTSSSPAQPVIQPSYDHSEPPLPSCPPPPSYVTTLQVASLGTVVPIDFTNPAQNTYDAALAPIIPGKVKSEIYTLPPFSGAPMSPVNVGLKVQKMGAASGFKTGRVTRINRPVEYKMCTRIPTKVRSDFSVVASSCEPMTTRFANHIIVKPSDFAKKGDSGALVLSRGPCPQPVGMVVGKDSERVYVAPISGVLQSLELAGGFSSNSLSVVPGKGGCTPTGEVEVVLANGSTQMVDGTVPDLDVLRAMNALPHFLTTWQVLVLMFQGVVVGVGIDLSDHPAALDVTADNGTFNGVSNVSYAQSLLPSSFEGVPVQVTKIDTVDLTTDGSVYILPN